MDHGGKIKKRFGLSLKTAKKNASEFSKPDSNNPTRKSDSCNTRSKIFDGYFTKQKQEKKPVAKQQDVKSNTELTEGTHGHPISSTRMKLLKLMPVFPDWENMAPLPFSPLLHDKLSILSISQNRQSDSTPDVQLMESLSEPKTVQCNDPKEGINENSASENNDAKSSSRWKDLPKFDAGYFADKVRQPLLTFADSDEDYPKTDSGTTSGALQVDLDLKSSEDNATEESNAVGKRKSNSSIEVDKRLETTGERKSNQINKELFEKEISGSVRESRVGKETSDVNETDAVGKRKSNSSIKVDKRLKTTGERKSNQINKELFEKEIYGSVRESRVGKGTSDVNETDAVGKRKSNSSIEVDKRLESTGERKSNQINKELFEKEISGFVRESRVGKGISDVNETNGVGKRKSNSSIEVEEWWRSNREHKSSQSNNELFEKQLCEISRLPGVEKGTSEINTVGKTKSNSSIQVDGRMKSGEMGELSQGNNGLFKKEISGRSGVCEVEKETSDVDQTTTVGKRKSRSSKEVDGKLRSTEERKSSQSNIGVFEKALPESVRVFEADKVSTSDDELWEIYQGIDLEEDSMDCMIVSDTEQVTSKRLTESTGERKSNQINKELFEKEISGFVRESRVGKGTSDANETNGVGKRKSNSSIEVEEWWRSNREHKSSQSNNELFEKQLCEISRLPGVEKGTSEINTVGKTKSNSSIQVDGRMKSGEMGELSQGNNGLFKKEISGRSGVCEVEKETSDVDQTTTVGKRKSRSSKEVDGKLRSTEKRKSSQSNIGVFEKALPESVRVFEADKVSTSDDELWEIYQGIDLEEDSMDCMIVSDTEQVTSKRLTESTGERKSNQINKELFEKEISGSARESRVGKETSDVNETNTVGKRKSNSSIEVEEWWRSNREHKSSQSNNELFEKQLCEISRLPGVEKGTSEINTVGKRMSNSSIEIGGRMKSGKMGELSQGNNGLFKKEISGLSGVCEMEKETSDIDQTNTVGKRKSRSSNEVDGKLRGTEERKSNQSNIGVFEKALPESVRVFEADKGSTSDDELWEIYQGIDLEEDSMDCMIVSDTEQVTSKSSSKELSKTSSEMSSNTCSQSKYNQPEVGSGNAGPKKVSVNYQHEKSPRPCVIAGNDNQKAMVSHVGECGPRTSRMFKNKSFKKTMSEDYKEMFVDNKTEGLPECGFENRGRMESNRVTHKNKMFSNCSDMLRRDDGNGAWNTQSGDGGSFCNPRKLNEQSNRSVDGIGYRDESVSRAVVSVSSSRTADFVNCASGSTNQISEVLQDRGLQHNDEESIGNPSRFDSFAKQPMSSADCKRKESFCNNERLGDIILQRTKDYMKPNKEETLVHSSSSFQSGYKNVHSEGSMAVPSRTGVSGNVNKKNDPGNQKHDESVGKSQNTTIPGNEVRGNKGEHQWIDEDSYIKENDGFDDLIRSLDGDLSDEDLVSCCDDLMSPIIPVRKNAARQHNYVAEGDTATAGYRPKSAKRRLEILDGQSKIRCSDSTYTFSSNPGLGVVPSRPTAQSGEKAVESVLRECPICLEHFQSGLSKRDIDQHIAVCLESEDMAKDSDDLFW